MDRALVGATVSIPLKLISRDELARLKQRLTIIPKSFGGAYGPVDPIISWGESDGYFHTPFNWGIEYCTSYGIELEDQLVDGSEVSFPRRPDPYHPKAPAGQEAFFDGVIAALQNAVTCFACAGTGTGKTATALNAIFHFGRTALIVVHTKELARQWREEQIPLHLGIPMEEVGIVEEGKMDYYGKRIVVAVVHNLINKDLHDDFTKNFGFIVWDEGHKLGAPAFNESTKKFPAAYRLVLTATPDRKDGCSVLITDFFGPIAVTSESTPVPCEVRIVNYAATKFYPTKMPRARIINKVCEDPKRNKEFSELIFSLYKAGKVFIGLSDRISQLQTILENLHEMGVPEKHLGLYTRQYDDGNGKRLTTTKEELEFYRSNAMVFLATYQMAREALDIPRIDSGMFLSPTSDGTQGIGRARRIYPGKTKAIWFVPKDLGQRGIIGSFYALLKGLSKLKDVTIIGN